jgi:osmotically-inducible protein OsmY
MRARDIMTSRLDEYAGGVRRWTVTVEGGVATVVGDYDNDTERSMVTMLARTVPGVAAVKVGDVTEV